MATTQLSDLASQLAAPAPALPSAATVVDKVTLSNGEREPDYTYASLLNNANARTQHTPMNETNSTASEPDVLDDDNSVDSDRLEKMLQQVLDRKVGLDRKKLEEIEEKIDALTAKEGELSEADQKQLELLQQQKDTLIKQAGEKLAAQQN